MCVYFVANLCACRIGLGCAHDAITFACNILCILMHTYFIFNTFSYYFAAWFFSYCLFLPLSLVYVSASMAPKRKSASSQNPLRSRAFTSSSYPTPFLFDSMIRMPERTSRRTFLNEVFIRNAESFWRTLPTLTFPLSFTVGDGSHYMTSRSLVHPC